MDTNTRITRALAAAGGGLIISLTCCLPAVAADGGTPADGVDVGAAKHGGVTMPRQDRSGSDSVDVGAAKHGGVQAPAEDTGRPAGVDVGRLLNSIDTPAEESAPSGATTPAPSVPGDDTLALGQIALGSLGGGLLAVGVVGAVVHHRNRQHAPRPA